MRKFFKHDCWLCTWDKLISYKAWLMFSCLWWAVHLYTQWGRAIAISEGLHKVSIWRKQECAFEASDVQLGKVLPKPHEKEEI